MQFFDEWKKKHGPKKDQIFKRFERICAKHPTGVLRYVGDVLSDSDGDTDSDENNEEDIEMKGQNNESKKERQKIR